MASEPARRDARTRRRRRRRASPNSLRSPATSRTGATAAVRHRDASPKLAAQLARRGRSGRARRRARSSRAGAAAARCPGVRAARRERARVRRCLERRQRPAGDRAQPVRGRVDVRPGGDERGGVRVQRVVVQQGGRAHLDDLPGVHHRRAVADGGGQLEVVGDEQQASPRSRRSSSRIAITSAWVVTSSAVVGSSASSRRGSVSSASAIMTRCSMPPDSSCGYCRSRRRRRRCRPRRARRAARRCACAAGTPRFGRSASVMKSPIAPHRVDVRARVLEDHRHLAAVPAQRGAGERCDVACRRSGSSPSTSAPAAAAGRSRGRSSTCPSRTRRPGRPPRPGRSSSETSRSTGALLALHGSRTVRPVDLEQRRAGGSAAVAALPPGRSSAAAWPVEQPLAEHVDRDHHDHDAHARRPAPPAGSPAAMPTWSSETITPQSAVRRLDAEAEERDRGQVDHRVAEQDRRLGDDQRQRCWGQVAQADRRWPRPCTSSAATYGWLRSRQRRAAQHPGDVRRVGDRQRDRRRGQARRRTRPRRAPRAGCRGTRTACRGRRRSTASKAPRRQAAVTASSAPTAR